MLYKFLFLLLISFNTSAYQLPRYCYETSENFHPFEKWTDNGCMSIENIAKKAVEYVDECGLERADMSDWMYGEDGFEDLFRYFVVSDRYFLASESFKIDLFYKMKRRFAEESAKGLNRIYVSAKVGVSVESYDYLEVSCDGRFLYKVEM